MTQRKSIRTPKEGEIQHLAGAYLYKYGSATEVELFLAVHFGKSKHEREIALQAAIRNGWLIETERGKIACSPEAVEYYDGQDEKPKEEYVGQITPSQYRGDWRAGSGLSKKYQINSRGLRPASDVAPTWSQRPEGFGFKSIAGGD